MPYNDLQEYLAYLDKRGQLRRIAAPVSPELEISAIAERVGKMPGGGPALFFENVEGTTFPALVNAFGSKQRLAWGLGLTNLNQLSEKVQNLLRPNQPQSFGEKLLRLGEMPEVVKFSPRPVKGALSQEVIPANNLKILPALKNWPEDGGKCLQRVVLAARDPLSGKRLLSVPHLQIFDEQTAGLVWQNDEEFPLPLETKTEVALVIGDDPALLVTAFANLPLDLDGYILAGYLRGLRLDVTKGHSISLDVPANAEIVLEGYIQPHETRLCGPFGQHNGHYAPAKPAQVFHLTAITHRRQPICPLGNPWQEEIALGKAWERLLWPFIKLNAPEITDINFSSFPGLLFASIQKSYPGQAQKVASYLWGMLQLRNIKFLIITDSDCDVQDPVAVTNCLINNLDPRRDANILNGPLSTLDFSSPTARFGSKMTLDATRKLSEEHYPRLWPLPAEFPAAIKRLLEDKWSSYGID
jgi:4-hydroxy-3-polyprenylbenzoate decarboxylase